MANKIFILNSILSFLIKLFKKLCDNWSTVRKVLIAVTFIIVFAIYLQSPDIKLQISNTARLTILQYEKTANKYMSQNDFDNAINQYKSAVSIILSQKNIGNITVDKDIQYRICTNASDAFLKYSNNNLLDERHKKTGRIFIEALNAQKKIHKDDPYLDSLIQKMNLAIA